jgi:hypothetical protein
MSNIGTYLDGIERYDLLSVVCLTRGTAVRSPNDRAICWDFLLSSMTQVFGYDPHIFQAGGVT